MYSSPDRLVRLHSVLAIVLLLAGCADEATSPRPASPAPDAVTIIVSDSNVVLNTMVLARDTAMVTVQAGTGSLTGLRASIRYAAGEPEGWLSTRVDQQGVAATVKLTADPGTRPAGEYHAVVTVTVPGATPQEVKVIARVMTSPAMGLSAGEICFTPFQDGPDARRDDVRVTSVDGSPIQGLSAAIIHEPGQPTGWLEAAFTSPDAPSRLWLQSTKAALPPGRYGATVVVSSTTPGIAPASFHVTLNIQAGPSSLASRVEVTIAWEGPQFAAIPTVSGRGGLHCGPVPYCTGVLDAGIGDFQMDGTADYGGRLLRWEGTPCLEGGLGGICTIRFTAPGSVAYVTAVYGTIPSSVNFLLQGEGASGTVTVTGAVNEGTDTPFSCRLDDGVPGPCRGTFVPGGGVVTVTATPDAGSAFSSWQVGSSTPGFPGPPCPPTTPTCTITFSQGNSLLDGIITFSN